MTDDSPTGSDLSGSGCQQPKGAGDRPALRSSMRASAHAGAGISEIGLEGSLARRHAAKTNHARIVKLWSRTPELWKSFFVSRADHSTPMRFGHTRPILVSGQCRGVPTRQTEFISFAGDTGRARSVVSDGALRSTILLMTVTTVRSLTCAFYLLRRPLDDRGQRILRGQLFDAQHMQARKCARRRPELGLSGERRRWGSAKPITTGMAP